MKLLLDLFLTFARIGAFTFGGGYAMLSLIEDTCVEKKKWITAEEMARITVIAESTPGPVAINCATYVGKKQAGVMGSAFATLGMVLPSFVIIFLISKFLDRFLEIPLVDAAFRGIRVAVGVLVLNAGLKLFKKLPKDVFTRVVLILAGVAMLLISAFSINFSTIFLLISGGVAALILWLAQGRKKAESQAAAADAKGGQAK